MAACHFSLHSCICSFFIQVTPTIDTGKPGAPPAARKSQAISEAPAGIATACFGFCSRSMSRDGGLCCTHFTDTVVRWHRQGFRFYWRWKSRGQQPGRSAIDAGLRKLIREMQATNMGWGVPRIHGELLKLGIVVSQTTVSKYMVHQQKPPSQTWRTFLQNHADCMAGIYFFTGAPAAVPTATFRVLYVFIVLSHGRRRIVHFNVTEHPTGQWTAQQLVEAFPFDAAPRYLLRDRDAIYGEAVRRRMKSLSIQEVVSAPRSPWQKP